MLSNFINFDIDLEHFIFARATFVCSQRSEPEAINDDPLFMEK